MKYQGNVDSDRNQAIKRALVNREVIYCVSSLVHELAQKAEEFPDYYDDLLDAFQGNPDYEEAATENGWQLEEGHEDEIVYRNSETGDVSDDAKTWEELCNEKGIDAYEYAPEIYEHWIVSDWLAARLEEHGERVLRDFFGMTIWGRSCSGQAIYLDYIISEIAAEMGILEGQANEWKNV
jgi:hypothetical protein